MGIIEAFAAYHLFLSSDEPIYFLISWVSSNLDFSKDLIMSIANAILANIIFRVLNKMNTSLYLIVFIICTNFYLFGLYFAAERLKFAFIFLFLAFLVDENVKKKYLLLFLSLISHIQVLIIIASSKFSNIIEKDSELNFMIYYKQIISIIYSNSLHNCYISKIPEFKNPLIINESPFKSFYNLEYTDTDICFNIHEDDIENLILQGFKDISNYMKQFEIETITT